MKKGKKVHLGPQLFRGEGEATLKSTPGTSVIPRGALNFPCASGARFWSQLPRIKFLTKTMKKGKKVHLGPQLFRGEAGGHSQGYTPLFMSVKRLFR